MENPIEAMRVTVEILAGSLDPTSFVMVQTSRGLDAIIDPRFETEVRRHKWYAILSRGNHLQAAADIHGRRVSLQRFILTLANPGMTLEEAKHISFANKIPFDCRLENISTHVGRIAVMRNRRNKQNSSSRFKGVRRKELNGKVTWRAEIASGEDRIMLGEFVDDRRAGLVYDAAAYLLFENAALYNMPDLCPEPEALKVAQAAIARYWVRKAKKIANRSISTGLGLHCPKT